MRDFNAVSMLTAPPQILLSVSVRLDTEVTPSEDVWMLMSVSAIPVAPVPGVLMKMEATSVNVPEVPEAIPTWLVVWALPLLWSVPMTRIVRASWPALLAAVSTPAPPSPVARTLSVYPRTTQPGAGVGWDTRRTQRLASAPLCVRE